MAYCPHCDGPLFKGKAVAVVGGGNSGVEAAIDLAGIVQHVTLLEYADALRADAVLVQRLKSLPNVTVITGAQTTEVIGDGTQLTGLRYIERASGAARELALAGVFVQIGLVPNTDWLQGTVSLSQRGEVEVDARGQTSVPGVFAAGDCTTTPYKQIVVALGEGLARGAGCLRTHDAHTGGGPRRGRLAARGKRDRLPCPHEPDGHSVHVGSANPCIAALLALFALPACSAGQHTSMSSGKWPASTTPSICWARCTCCTRTTARCRR